MIYLIAGAPRCGKTIIAKKLSKKLDVSWISSDTLESIVSVYTNKKNYKKLFPKKLIRQKTKQSNDMMYNTYSTGEIVRSYIKQSRTSWKAIETLIDCSLKEGLDYIIEGHQIHPKLVNKIRSEHGSKNIKSLIVTRFDNDKIVSGCLKHKSKSDWFIQKTRKHDTYYKIAEMIKKYSTFFEEESKKYRIDTINVDSKFPTKLNEAVNKLSK